jgi:NADH-quinone oxidoreductase subunit F
LDIHVSDAAPTEEERAAVDALLGPPTSRWEGGDRNSDVDSRVAHGGHAARERRHLLLPALHALNDRVGWISKGGLNYVCERLTIPPADAYGVASFYHMFSLKPRPKTVVYVCDDIACMCSGAEQLCDELDDPSGPAAEALASSHATWVRSPCLGLCEVAPAAIVTYGGDLNLPMSCVTAGSLLQQLGAKTGDLKSRHVQVAEKLRLAPEMTPVERRAAIEKAMSLGPARITEEIVASKLMGRGGAAFPTGRKWKAVAEETERPHFIVCNADESEPGTFKDRDRLLRCPSRIIVGMTIAAIAGHCEHGYLYIRGEYGLAASYIRHRVLPEMRSEGLLGDNILGSGFDFDIEIRRGAGAYICGEETALFNSIEGFRGEPRNKPPFPVQKGLFGKPTIVNNVETLVNIPDIILEGGEAFAKIGTPESTGTRLFCLSGCVEMPGVYEFPFGITLRALIETAGGVRGGKNLQAVLLGGAAGSFLTPDELDVELSFEGVRKINASLGSGVVMLFDETIDLRKIVARIAAFFRDESCGQCVPCRVGTARQEELLHRVAAGKTIGSLAGEKRLLEEIGQVMRDASICGLGQTASSAIESAVAKFDLFGGYRTA